MHAVARSRKLSTWLLVASGRRSFRPGCSCRFFSLCLCWICKYIWQGELHVVRWRAASVSARGLAAPCQVLHTFEEGRIEQWLEGRSPSYQDQTLESPHRGVLVTPEHVFNDNRMSASELAAHRRKFGRRKTSAELPASSASSMRGEHSAVSASSDVKLLHAATVEKRAPSVNRTGLNHNDIHHNNMLMTEGRMFPLQSLICSDIRLCHTSCFKAAQETSISLTSSTPTHWTPPTTSPTISMPGAESHRSIACRIRRDEPKIW